MNSFNKTSCKSNSFYNARSFIWGGRFPSLEISSGGSRFNLINAMQSSSMATAAVKTCEIIARETVTTALLVPPMIDLVTRKNIPSNQLQQGCMIVHSSFLQSIDKLCDELTVVYACTELAFVSSKTYNRKDDYNTTNRSLNCRQLPGDKGYRRWRVPTIRGPERQDDSDKTNRSLNCRPLSGGQKITDDDEFLIPVGQRSSIPVRSLRRFDGYLNQNLPPKSKETRERTGWFCPDDGGYVTEDGELVVEGRLQEIIQVLGWRKMFPFDIENVIETKSSVSSAIVMSGFCK